VVKLTDEHVARAFRIARWYGRRARRVEISDLESAALEGLAKAARDFDDDVVAHAERPPDRKRSFWCFAFNRILGEMKDELRRLDHLTREQRALVAEDEAGVLAVADESMKWMNPQEPLPLDASLGSPDGDVAPTVVDAVEEPRNPIEEFELRDAFCRASEALPERHRFVLLKRELEGYSNAELAEAFDVTEGRTSQIRGAAIERMREEIGDSFVDAA
jgi:RNA polymerase sigma factor (sigma-70 family)